MQRPSPTLMLLPHGPGCFRAVGHCKNHCLALVLMERGGVSRQAPFFGPAIPPSPIQPHLLWVPEAAKKEEEQ